MKTAISAVVAMSMAVTGASAAVKPSEAERLATAARVVHDVRPMIPQDTFAKARCVIVTPEVKTAAAPGNEYRSGVMSCRSGERWSPPVLVQLAKGSRGVRVGGQDLILLVMNESGVQKLFKEKVALGADASVAAGPISTIGAVPTDAMNRAEILSYSRARGVLAGLDLSGGVLRPEDAANKSVYGPTASVRTILAGTEISAPPEAAPFLAALSAAAPSVSASSATPAAAVAAAPKTPTPSSDDIRAQLTSMQQTLDNMLANPPAAAVGTAGTADAAAASLVTVDRAQLLRLRQQLDALLADANRR